MSGVEGGTEREKLGRRSRAEAKLGRRRDGWVQGHLRRRQRALYSTRTHGIKDGLDGAKGDFIVIKNVCSPKDTTEDAKRSERGQKKILGAHRTRQRSHILCVCYI